MSLKSELSDQDTPETIDNVVLLHDYVIKRYELKEPRFIRTQGHLCLCCDLFFQHVKKGRVVLGQETVKKEIVSKHTEHVYPHWPKFFQFVDAATHGCHICRFFLSQLTTEEQDSLLNFERTNGQHGTIQLLLPSRFHRAGQHQVQLRFGPPAEMQIRDNRRGIFDCLTMDQTVGKNP